MLYSLNYIKSPNQHRRLMFYAEDEEKALDYLRAAADRMALDESEVWLEKHPNGFIYNRVKLGPHYWPAKEPKKRVPTQK